MATLTATDTVTPVADLTWSIPADAAGGADRGKFTLSSGGVLAFASAQDFENPDDADTNGIYAVTVEVSDGDLTDTADLTVTLTNINEAPTADAGADQTGVLPSTVVTLSGTGSDPDAGDTLRYRWTQTGSQAGTLTNADAATATFTAPPAVTAVTTFTFTLRVTDAGDLYDEDTVTVTVNPLLTAQFENAPVNHDRFNSFSVVLRFSENVELNSNAFSHGLLTITNGTLLFHGQLTEGSNIAWRFDVAPPTDRTDMIITLPANRACDPDAAPCTSDGRRLSAEASVTVTSWTPPVLTSATTLTAAENQTAVATLTATDDETPVADLTWILQAPGSSGAADEDKFTLSDDGVLAFQFAQDFEYPDDANSDGRYEVKIHISDEDRQLTTETLTVTLTNVNEEPTADAGADQTNVVPGTAVTLSGSESSDPDADDTLGYLWTQTGGPMVGLNDENTATATFTAPAAVTEATALTFTLRVTDAGDLFHEDTVTVTVRPQPPVITSAASLTVAENQTAVATLTATDADTPVADLTWSIPADAAGGADRGKFTLSSGGVLAFASTQDFENPDDADTNGIYAVTVEVSDGSLTDTADLTVTLTNVNEAPTADAGADQTGVVPGTVVTLSGSGSSDPDAGDTLTYLWTQTGASTVTLTDANAATATFNVPSDSTEPVTLTFTLRVTDAGDLFHEDTVTVTVQAAGTLALNVGAIAGDDIINIAEKVAGFAISGDTGTEAGVTVTVQVGTATLSATSADVSGTATWSVSVPVDASYITGESVVVTVSAAKTGFIAPSAVERTLTVDLVAPVAPTYTAPGSLTVGAAITTMSPTGASGVSEYDAPGLPAGLGIDAGTGVISGTPTAAATDTASVTVTVSDTAGNSATVSITFPAVAKGDQTLSGFSYSASSVTFGSAAPIVTAPSGAQGALSYAATPSTVCTVEAATGVLTLAGVGSCEVTVTAAATANYNEATASYTVTVQTTGSLLLNVDAVTGDDTVNIAEKESGFAISGDTGTEGDVSVTVGVGGTNLTATSSTSDPAIWSVNVPADASYITGTSVDVTVSAAKTGFTAPADVQRTLVIDLTAPTAPTYTAPDSLKVGAAITTMSPTGASGVSEYDAPGLPAGLSIDASTGVISGTPTAAATGAASVTVTVSDTAGNSATVSITFPAVAKGEQTLNGFSYSASSVTFGSAAPTLTAPGGAQGALSYAASPSNVCTVEAATGALTLTGAGSCAVTVTAAATANYNAATDSYTVTVNSAGALTLNVDTIAGDDIINIAEKAAGFAISGNTGTEGDVSVTVGVGGTNLTATSSTSDPAIWSVNVPVAAGYITGTSVNVSVTASKAGYTSPSTVEHTLTVDLVAPTAPTYTAPGSLTVGAAITTMSPTEASGVSEYDAPGLPAGLSIDAVTGVISGTPTTAATDTASVTVTVSDTAGNTDTVSITFPAVAKGEQTLSGFSYSSSSVTFGSAAPTVTAPGGAQGALSYTASPSGVCTVEAATGALTLTGVGSCAVTVTAAATANYNAATDSYTVTVQTAGSLVLNVDAVTGDDIINIAEKAAGFAISGNTGTEGDVSVTVGVGGTNLTATSSTSDPAIWSVNVPVAAGYITGTSVVVSVTASKAGYTSPSAVARTLTVDLTAPTAPTYTAPGSLKVGAAITTMSPTEASGVSEYDAPGLPAGLSIDAVTGVISGTPTTAATDTASVTVTVSDTAGNTDTVSITFPAVAKGDQTLSGFSYSASSVTFGSAAPTLTAPGGAQGALSYAASPSNVCTVEAATGALTLTGVGSCAVTVTAAATANYNAATDSYTVTVQTAGSLVLNVDAVTGDDIINITEKAKGFAISGNTGTEGDVSVTVGVGGTNLTATSSTSDPAIWSVNVPVAAGYITGTSVDVTVSAAKTGFIAPSAVERTLTVDLTAPVAPSYTAPGSLKVGAAITSMSPTGASDVNEYSASGLPAGLGINAGAGVISGTPTAAATDTASVTVTVSDSGGNTDTVSITFPAVAKGDQTLSGFSYSASSVTFGSAAPTVTAPSGVETTLSYAASPSDVCTVNAATGALTLAGAGSCAVTVTAADTANYNEARASYTVTVQTAGSLVLNVDTIASDDTVNIAEKAEGFVISGDTGTEAGVSVTVQVGTGTLSATSTDASGIATWSVNVPAGASYITGTGVSVSVTAAKAGYTSPDAVQRALDIGLTAPVAPSYTAPGSLKVGAAITEMSPTGARDVNEYAASGLPTGLSINTGTGVISGTPTAAATATASVTVTVSDSAGNTDTVSITFPAVAKGEQTLSGFSYSASSVTFGSAAPTLTAPGGAQGALSYAASPSNVCTVGATTGALTLTGVGSCTVTVTAAATADYEEGSDTATVTVTVQTAGTLLLNLDMIAGDNTVNIAEKAAGFAISGDTGTEAGVAVTVQVGTATLSATSADDSGTATWSVDVPADTPEISGTSVDVRVTASKAGYTSPSAVQRTLTVDLDAPEVVSIVRHSPAASPTDEDSLVWRVTFSEAIANLDAADFAVTGTTATITVASVGADVIDVTITGGDLTDLDGTVTLAFASAQNIIDRQDNALSNTTPTGTNDNNYVVDNTAPAVTIGDVPATSTAQILVSNSGASVTNTGATSILAQSITTGGHRHGYTVSQIEINIFSFEESRRTTVKLYSNSNNGQPQDLVATLVNPLTFTGGFNTFTAPPGTTLSRNTTYWIVLNEDISNASSERVGYNTTTSKADTSSYGWSIGDKRLHKLLQTGSWGTNTYSVIPLTVKGNLTNAAPEFDDHASLTRSIAENTAADVNVGAVIPEAKDTDSGDTLTYSMEGTDAASFNFNASRRGRSPRKRA